MSKPDKELADELDAQDRLIARGYIKMQCDKCDGFGYVLPAFTECSSCEGRGYFWQAPITK